MSWPPPRAAATTLGMPRYSKSLPCNLTGRQRQLPVNNSSEVAAFAAIARQQLQPTLPSNDLRCGEQQVINKAVALSFRSEQQPIHHPGSSRHCSLVWTANDKPQPTGSRAVPLPYASKVGL